MKIIELKRRPGFDQDKKLINSYDQFDKLLIELKKKEASGRNCKFYK